MSNTAAPASAPLPPEKLVKKTLAECIEWIENAIPHADRRLLENMEKKELILCHMGLGMHIRNNCNLWTAGCDEVVVDIKRIHDTGAHPLPLIAKLGLNWDPDFQNTTTGPGSLYHPDNCSAVIIDLYHDLIRGDIGLALIERKP